MNTECTMIGELTEPVKIGTANLANINHQEIAGVCPYCSNGIRIPIYPVINARTYIDELEYRIHLLKEALDTERAWHNFVKQRLDEIKTSSNHERYVEEGRAYGVQSKRR